jgi:hypothetical protein
MKPLRIGGLDGEATEALSWNRDSCVRPVAASDAVAVFLTRAVDTCCGFPTAQTED